MRLVHAHTSEACTYIRSTERNERAANDDPMGANVIVLIL